MKHDDIYGWIYSYDRKHRVWRAFYSGDDVEINQYHKAELLFLMDHRNDKVTWDSSTLTQVPVLTLEERLQFLIRSE